MYESVKSFITDIPQMLDITSEAISLALSLDMYERFYKKCEEEETPLVDKYYAVEYVLSPYRDIDKTRYPIMRCIHNMLLYRLVFLHNEDGEFDSLLEKLKEEMGELYEFNTINASFDDLAEM